LNNGEKNGDGLTNSTRIVQTYPAQQKQGQDYLGQMEPCPCRQEKKLDP